MAWIFGRETKCPYCFEAIEEEALVFRCSNRACPEEQDEALAAFYASLRCPDETMLQPVVHRTAPIGKLGRMFGKSTPLPSCPRCRQSTAIELCPHCHMELPNGWTQAPSRVVVLVGSISSGKTILTHVLLRELERQFPR